MRFLLYNIRYGTGRRTRHAWMDMLRRTDDHFADITNFIRELKPDVVGLVETDGGSFRTGNRSQPRALAQAMGHNYSFGIKYKADGWLSKTPVFNKQGNALLSRSQIRRERFHFFERGFKRLVIEMELDEVIIFLVHLSLRHGVRQRQLVDLWRLVRQAAKPCIVAGDFNTLHGTRELDDFLKSTGMQQANEGQLPTYPSWDQNRVLDFVCYSPAIKLRSFALPQVTYSDHLPLVCDFELPAAPAVAATA